MRKPKIVVAPERCCDYLTPGKEYEIKECMSYSQSFGWYFNFKLDTVERINSNVIHSAHLNGKDWIIKEYEDEKTN